MCGINGIIEQIDEFRLRDKMVHMNQAISHRGPDGAGIRLFPGLALGHVRLSIIDVDERGRQPMDSDDGNLSMVFNGEIYNYKALRREFHQYPFKTETDSETILAAYKKYEMDCVKKMDGMFAFAIYDIPAQTLFLARDRAGKKPLYYYHHNNVFIFSSEIRAILKTAATRFSLNKDVVPQYLMYQTVYSPDTIVKQIKQLPAGSYAVFKDGQLTIKKYWEIEDTQKKYSLAGPYETVIKQTRELLFKAVEKRLMSDVPLGAFLSGGIDSSAIVGIMSKFTKDNINTFNINFSEAEFSEEKYANLIAEKYKTNHHNIRLKQDDFLSDLQSALVHMDHPSADGPNTFVVSKHTRAQGIKVALSGVGGDELFGGYPLFGHLLKIKKFRKLEKLPVFARKSMFNMIKNRFGQGEQKKLEEIFSMQDWSLSNLYPIFRQSLSLAEVSAIAGGTAANAAHFPASIEDNKWLSNISIAEITTYLQNVLLRDADQMSMAHALEVRAPFMDKYLMEYILSLPDEFKPLSTPKKLLTDALSDIIPEEIWNRPKMGFTLPWKHWINNELKAFCVYNLDYLMDLKILNMNYVESLAHSLENGPENSNWYNVWNAVVLSHYINVNNLAVDA